LFCRKKHQTIRKPKKSCCSSQARIVVSTGNGFAHGGLRWHPVAFGPTEGTLLHPLALHPAAATSSQGSDTGKAGEKNSLQRTTQQCGS